MLMSFRTLKQERPLHTYMLVMWQKLLFPTEQLLHVILMEMLTSLFAVVLKLVLWHGSVTLFQSGLPSFSAIC